MRARYASDPEKWREYSRQYALKNPEQIRATRQRGTIKRREYRIERRKDLRNSVLERVGGKFCVRCGYDKDTRALQIDHINGGGARERAAFPGDQLLKKILAMPIDEVYSTYQILCCNCNSIKKYENRELGARALKYEIKKTSLDSTTSQETGQV